MLTIVADARIASDYTHSFEEEPLVIFAQVWLSVLSSSISSSFRRGRRAQTGQGLIEYALIIALVAVVAVVGLTILGGKLSQTFSNAVENLNLPNPGA